MAQGKSPLETGRITRHATDKKNLNIHFRGKEQGNQCQISQFTANKLLDSSITKVKILHYRF